VKRLCGLLLTAALVTAGTGVARAAGPETTAPANRQVAHALGGSGKVPRRVVTVSWTAAENARLRRMAVYMHRTPAATQQAAVHIVWYLLGGATGRAAPVSLPPAGTAASYTNVWYQSDLSALDGLRAHFGVNSADATRIAVYVYSYLLALRGV